MLTVTERRPDVGGNCRVQTNPGRERSIASRFTSCRRITSDDADNGRLTGRWRSRIGCPKPRREPRRQSDGDGQPLASDRHGQRDGHQKRRGPAHGSG